jgi:hypothetical protein
MRRHGKQPGLSHRYEFWMSVVALGLALVAEAPAAGRSGGEDWLALDGGSGPGSRPQKELTSKTLRNIGIDVHVPGLTLQPIDTDRGTFHIVGIPGGRWLLSTTI